MAFRYLLASACASAVLAPGCGSGRPKAQTPRTEAHASVQLKLAVFSHRLLDIGSTTIHGLPHGAVLARLSGRNHIYVSQQLLTDEDSPTESSYLCLTDVEHDETAGTACGPTESVEHEGLVAVHSTRGRVRLGMLLPNGVTTVTIENSDGTRRTAEVKNNVVEVEDDHPRIVEYALIEGLTHREPIPHEFVSSAGTTHP